MEISFRTSEKKLNIRKQDWIAGSLKTPFLSRAYAAVARGRFFTRWYFELPKVLTYASYPKILDTLWAVEYQHEKKNLCTLVPLVLVYTRTTAPTQPARLQHTAVHCQTGSVAWLQLRSCSVDQGRLSLLLYSYVFKKKIRQIWVLPTVNGFFWNFLLM